MAYSTLVAEKGLKELEKEITCPVCHDHFQEPKILPCCHYYCKQCIQVLVQTSGANQPFPCPECRRDILLPQNGPDQLPTAFFVNRMKELHTKMEKASGKVEAQCEMCSSGHKVTAFCRQCVFFICHECVKSHQKMKIFSAHLVTTLDEMNKGGSSRILTRQQTADVPVCPDHEEKMKIYCLKCKRVICHGCVLMDHKDHPYEFTKKVSSEAKKNISERLSSLKELHKNVHQAIADVNVTKDDITAQKVKTIEDIEEKFRELHEVLDKHKKLLLEETFQTAEQMLENLSAQEKQLDTTSAAVQSVVDSIELNVGNSTDGELIFYQENILESIDEALSKHGDNDLQPVEEADIRADLTITTDDFHNILMSKAQVKHTSADPTKCVLEYRDAGTQEYVTMTLKPYLPNSKPTMKIQSIEAFVTSKADRLVFLVSPTRMPDNSYKITFKPQIRGRHEVEVTINDERLAGSPFPILAQIPPSLLGKPVRIIGGVKKPWGIAINSKDELVITEHNGNVVFLDKLGRKLREIKRRDHSFEFLSGVAVDDDDHVYVADYNLNTLFKFDQSGKLLKIVGQKGSGPGDLNKPRGLAVANGQLYVCDYDNNRIQVLTLELDFVREITHFSEVRDVAIDEHGHLYICDTGNNRIQVFNNRYELSHSFKAKDKRDLIGPCGICVTNNFVYVVENPYYKDENVSVFTKEGKFVTSFGESGKNGGQFRNPYGITMDKDGFLYVCDYGNSRIQVF